MGKIKCFQTTFSDLKGAPPNMGYFKQLIPLIESAGATDILIEYEDMFPYWGPIKNVSALNAYSRKVTNGARRQ